MKIAVTGGTGFVGRHVVAHLMHRNMAPLLVLRSESPTIKDFQELPSLRLDLDHPDPAALDKLGEIDVLLHLAWGGLPNYKSLHHFENQLPIHYRFLKAAVEAGVKHVLVAGTCAEYGLQSGALTENLAARPGHAYALAKDSLRRQLELLKQHRSFGFTWARLFYLYGEGQAESSLLSQLKRAVERGDSRFDMSGGEQLRDFLPVTQAAQLLVALALAREEQGVVNVCSGRPISVRRLVEEWLAQAQVSIELNLGHYPYPDYEPMAFWGDSAKLNRCLEKSGYTHQGSLRGAENR